MARIGIFPGSFNPIHKGHLKLIKYSLNNLKLDYLYLIPCYQSVDKSKDIYIPIKQRINALRMVKPKKTIISLWEINQKKPILTYKTINHFKKIHPNDELFFLIGSDYQKSFFTWEKNEQIQAQTTIYFFNRINHLINTKSKKNIHYLNNPLWNFSSTKYRQGKKTNVPLIINFYFGICYFFNKINI